jgi:hypothetical protein
VGIYDINWEIWTGRSSHLPGLWKVTLLGRNREDGWKLYKVVITSLLYLVGLKGTLDLAEGIETAHRKFNKLKDGWKSMSDPVSQFCSNLMSIPDLVTPFKPIISLSMITLITLRCNIVLECFVMSLMR